MSMTVALTAIALLSVAIVVLFVLYRRSLKGLTKAELRGEISKEVIKNVKKANDARARVKSDSTERKRLRKKYTRK